MQQRHWFAFILANSLTLARMLVGLAFPLIGAAWRAPVVAVAAASDLVDGAISRRFGGTSSLGRLLDPIADKTFVLMVLGTLWSEGAISLVEIALLGLREWVVLAISLGLMLWGNWSGLLRMAPRWSGKLATAAQLTFVVSLLVLRRNVPALFQLTVLLSGVAAADYLWRGLVLARSDSGANDTS